MYGIFYQIHLLLFFTNLIYRHDSGIYWIYDCIHIWGILIFRAPKRCYLDLKSLFLSWWLTNFHIFTVVIGFWLRQGRCPTKRLEGFFMIDWPAYNRIFVEIVYTLIFVAMWLDSCATIMIKYPSRQANFPYLISHKYFHKQKKSQIGRFFENSCQPGTLYNQVDSMKYPFNPYLRIRIDHLLDALFYHRSQFRCL